MDKIFIIGNGFDIAHGLNTRYSDFLLWYLNDTISKRNLQFYNTYEDNLLKIYKSNGEINNLLDIKNIYNRKEIEITSNYFLSILQNYFDKGWVDIEYAYYEKLLSFFYPLESIRNSTEKEMIIDELIKVNKEFEYIKNTLVKYLNEIKYDRKNFKESIYTKILREHELNDKKERINKVIYLVFNYTSTIQLYNSILPKYDDKIIYIHGELNNKSNPIIFGYGDESDVYYEKIERLNINEFTRNFKSFHYYNTDNYKNLFNSLNDKYEIIIMGHSCGISDRVLLKELFTSDKCQAIKIYHYQKDDGSNDYITKTQEISRHFTAELKHRMRMIVKNIGPLT